jgi:hypothetical protein
VRNFAKQRANLQQQAVALAIGLKRWELGLRDFEQECSKYLNIHFCSKLLDTVLKASNAWPWVEPLCSVLGRVVDICSSEIFSAVPAQNPPQ